MMTNIPSIGNTAANALLNVGITKLEQVSLLDEENLLKIHGVGPKAVSILKQSLENYNLSFESNIKLPYSPSFAVFGTLGCNNAPKREIIRDFIIGSYTNHKKSFEELCTEDFNSHIALPDKKINTLEIINIITHGKEGAAEGVTTTVDGEEHSWALFINFEGHKKNAKIKSVTSYVK